MCREALHNYSNKAAWFVVCNSDMDANWYCRIRIDMTVVVVKKVVL